MFKLKEYLIIYIKIIIIIKNMEKEYEEVILRLLLLGLMLMSWEAICTLQVFLIHRTILDLIYN